MRRLVCIFMTVLAVLLCGSCQRRPFAESRSKVSVVLDVNTTIINHVQSELPGNMRVDLYDPETAELVYTDYISPEGGYIHPAPGIYDMIVYSIGSESTLIHNEHNYNEIEAYTNEVSAFIKSQLAQFLAKRAKAAKERAAKEYAAALMSGDPMTKEPPVYSEEPVVNQPDHMFVGWYHNLEVPVVYEDDPIREIYVEVEAHTIVETWMVEVQTVEGSQWISSMVSLMSGQRGSVHIGPNIASEKVVSVFFEMAVEDREDGGKCLKGKFNTFGKHPDYSSDLSFDLNVKDTGGGDQLFHFDVTDQFTDNEERYILIKEKVVVEEPKVQGGGFQPTVDDWDEVRTDIIL